MSNFSNYEVVCEPESESECIALRIRSDAADPKHDRAIGAIRLSGELSGELVQEVFGDGYNVVLSISARN